MMHSSKLRAEVQVWPKLCLIASGKTGLAWECLRYLTFDNLRATPKVDKLRDLFTEITKLSKHQTCSRSFTLVKSTMPVGQMWII